MGWCTVWTRRRRCWREDKAMTTVCARCGGKMMRDAEDGVLRCLMCGRLAADTARSPVQAVRGPRYH